MMKVVEEALKLGPGLLVGFLLGIGAAEWINAGNPTQKLDPSGYKLIVLLVSVVVVALWRFVGAPLVARRKAGTETDSDGPDTDTGD